MRFLKTTTLSAILLSAAAVAASAQDVSVQSPAARPQIAANPGVPASTTRLPGPKVGPSTWISASPSAAQPAPAGTNSGGNSGSFYSGQAFGPKPN